MSRTFALCRTCISCFKKSKKDEFFRIVKAKDNGAVIDTEGNAFGRGAYLCKDEKCILAALKKQKLSRALRCEVKAELYENLLKMCGDENGQSL